MRGNTMLDDVEQQEMMQAFGDPASKGALVPHDGFSAMATGVQIHDGIITARKVEVERDEAKVLQKIAARAAVAGTDWFYRFPVKKKGGGQDWIEGPSIKCANNVARLFGNCQIDTRVQDAGASWIIYAKFVDYETGFSYTRPFQQNKNAAKIGGSDDARRLDIALQIGVSKAIRNVICNALEHMTDYAFEEAKRNLVGRVGKNIEHYKTKVKERLAELKVDLKRVELVFGRTYDKWLAPEVAQIIAELQAINDGMATIDETWPPQAPAEPQRGEFKGKGPMPGEDQTPADDANKGQNSGGGDSGGPAGGGGPSGKPVDDAEPEEPSKPKLWTLANAAGEVLGEYPVAEWAAQAAETAGGLQGDDLARFRKANGDVASKISTHPDADQALRDSIHAWVIEEAETSAPTNAPAKKDWSIDASVTGLDNKLKAILAHMPKTTNGKDVDDLWAAHADFLDNKLGRKKADIKKVFDDRKLELRAGAED